MKRLVLILAAVSLVLAMLSGCAAQPQAKEYDLDELSKAVEESGSFTDILSEVDLPTAAKLYKVDEGIIADCEVLCSTGATTEEIGLFRCADEDAAKTMEQAAKDRAEAQKVAYESYAPGEIPKLDDAVIKRVGVYVFYIVSDDPAAVAAIVK